MNFKTAELVGAIIGDGNMWKPKYEIVITGDKEKEREYFRFLSDIIYEEFGYTATIKYLRGGLRLKVRSKRIFNILEAHFPLGKRAETAFIPKGIPITPALRGIFDTDGTIFFSKKPGVEKYPTIEITTISRVLALQIFQALQLMDFRVKIRSFKENHMTYKISLNGKKQVAKWLEKIGSSNQTKLSKLIIASKNDS